MDVLSFGEILWDVFSNKRVIGGAPFNFSAHFSKMGGKAGLITAVGSDKLGVDALECIRKMNVSTDFVCINTYTTGACFVSIDQNGIPSYELGQDMAYDHIVPTSAQWNAIRESHAHAFYFGTLAQRNEESRTTVSEILSNCRFAHIFYDINIRQKWFCREVVEKGLNACTILKVSREEAWVFHNLGLLKVKNGDFEQQKDYYWALCRTLAQDYCISTVLLTLDKDGAMVYDSSQDVFHFSRKPKGRVTSTVGAGDSFSACYLYQLLKGQPVDQCLDKAILLSDYVIQHTEAIPEYTNDLKASLD